MNYWIIKDGEQTPSNEWFREGKPEYPDLIRVYLNRHQAYSYALSLIEQLKDENDKELYIVLNGKLIKNS